MKRRADPGFRNPAAGRREGQGRLRAVTPIANGTVHTTMYDQTRARQPADQPPGLSGQRAPGPKPLLPTDERDKIVRRLGHAVNTFADTPGDAMEEAESAFDEATDALVNALTERRRVLRASWQDQDPETQSAELRLALREYREIIQRLLRA